MVGAASQAETFALSGHLVFLVASRGGGGGGGGNVLYYSSVIDCVPVRLYFTMYIFF